MEQGWAEVIEFCALAYVLTWIPHWTLVRSRRHYSLGERTAALLYGLGLLGPSVAAFTVEARRRGLRGVRKLASSASPRVLDGWRLAGAVAAEPAMVGMTGALARHALRLQEIDPVVAAGQLWVVAGEEFGWRGFLLPRLRRKLRPLAAIVVVAAVWGAWHLPMFFVEGSPQAQESPGEFATAVLAWSALHHLFQLRRSGVAAAMIFHAAANLGATGLQVERPTRWRSVVYLITAAAAIGATELVEHCANSAGER